MNKNRGDTIIKPMIEITKSIDLLHTVYIFELFDRSMDISFVLG